MHIDLTAHDLIWIALGWGFGGCVGAFFTGFFRAMWRAFRPKKIVLDLTGVTDSEMVEAAVRKAFKDHVNG